MQTVGFGLWAMRGPDPAVPGTRMKSRTMKPELRKQLACGVVGGPSPGLLREEFVGCGRAGGEIYVHMADRVLGGADGAYNRLLSRTVTAAGCRGLHRGRLRSAG